MCDDENEKRLQSDERERERKRGVVGLFRLFYFSAGRHKLVQQQQSRRSCNAINIGTFIGPSLLQLIHFSVHHHHHHLAPMMIIFGGLRLADDDDVVQHNFYFWYWLYWRRWRWRNDFSCHSEEKRDCSIAPLLLPSALFNLSSSSSLVLLN